MALTKSPPWAAIAAAVIVATAVVTAFWPRAIGVDAGRIARGPLRVAVVEEGKTRVKQVYVVSTPVAGKVLRLSIDAGDEVVKDQTVVAVIQPAAPPFLDHRSRHEAEALVAATAASIAFAAAELRQAESELEFASSELKRSELLAKSKNIAERTLEKARIDVEVRRAAIEKAKAAIELKRREHESAKARLIGPENVADFIDGGSQCCTSVRSPVSGRVLKRIQSSENVVAAGAPLVEIGDVGDLEIVAELLSTDAVRIREGADARIEGWGGTRTLDAKVRRIEPSAFTKVSALGIEEQRVRTILDFTGAERAAHGLGHDYRVLVSITVWQSDAALRVPLSALFRSAGQWAVFKVDGGRARLAPVTIGHRSADAGELLAGLAEGDAVILHPSDRITDGARVKVR